MSSNLIKKYQSSPAARAHAKGAFKNAVLTLAFGVSTYHENSIIFAWLGGATMAIALYELVCYLDRAKADAKAEIAYRSIDKNG